MKKIHWLILLFLLLAVIVVTAALMNKSGAFSHPLLSPLSPLTSLNSINNVRTDSKNSKIILGFLPYWNLKYASSFRYSQLTDIAFFGLEVDKDGSILKYVDRYHEEPGWTALRSPMLGEVIRKSLVAGVRIHLVLRSFDNETIEAILADPQAQHELITQTLQIMKEKRFNGVNIDFEYIGSPPDVVRQRFADFIKLFQASCHELSASCKISVDAYADAATEDRLWDLSVLSQVVDHVVAMTYDFTRPTSEYSGPVAPLQSVKESIAAYSKAVPAEKLLLGIPYYGYEWPTVFNEPRSKARGKGVLATYRRIRQEMSDTPAIRQGWDEDGFSPFLISTVSGYPHQTFYDDDRSLGLKYDFVNETDLSGIAIWALGYDAPYPELWDLLAKKFPNTSSR